jgi:hypothetical protein
VGSALDRASKILMDHLVELDAAPDLPMLAIDSAETARING